MLQKFPLKDMIYLSPPDISKADFRAISSAMESNWIAPVGPHIDEFQDKMEKFLGSGHCCALSSGTAALHLAIRILNIKRRDVVLCPSFTFAASANAICYENAIPVFIDVDPQTWTIDIRCVEKAIIKYKPKAIITVDLYGQPCDYDEIKLLCKRYGVFIIQDSAEALGSEYKCNKLGNNGDIGVFSFNGNKIITTSGGGMICSENKNFIEKAKFLSTQAREPYLHYEHRELGFNYRMSNILASLGISQLSKITQFINKRRRIFDRYFKALSKIEGITFLKEKKNTKSNRWLTTLRIDPIKAGTSKNQLIEILSKEKIESRPLWKPMHLQPFYNDSEYIMYGDRDYSKSIYNDGVCLPSGSNLSKLNQDRIIDIILSSLKKNN